MLSANPFSSRGSLPKAPLDRPLLAGPACDLAYFWWRLRDIEMPVRFESRVDNRVTRGTVVMFVDGFDRWLFDKPCKAAIVELYDSPERHALVAQRLREAGGAS